MITPFASVASGSISASTFTSTTIYARSTQAADTGTLTVSGLDASSVAQSEAFTLTGKREVAGSDSFTKAVAAALSATQTGNVTVYSEGTAANGLCYLTAQPTAGDKVTLGLTGYTQDYTYQDTTASAYDVKIGADVATTTANLAAAINADGVGDGTDYHTGTAANPYLTATGTSGIITLTDIIKCARLLSWACSRSGATINIANPTGGVDGTVLATLSASQVAAYNAISLDDEALTQGLLPGLVNWTSDPVRVSGKRFSIHVAAEDVTTAMATSYEYSTQVNPTVWRSGITSITSLDTNSQIITPAEVVENIRLKINNTNAAAASVNAKVCVG